MSAARENPSTAVVRALDILEAVGERGAGLTNSEISRRLKIPKSSASYILRSLERRGYLRREAETARYRLGLKVLSLGHGVRIGQALRESAVPILRRLVSHLQVAAHLAVLDRGEAVYIEKVEAPGFIKMDTWVGRGMQINSTSVGKALAAYLPPGELAAILKEQGLKRRTPKTITVAARFLRELERVRSQGYAVDDEENSLGVRCVAAPVFDDSGQVEAAVGVSGTTRQVDKASLRRIADLLRDASREISRQLGAQTLSRPPSR